MVFLVFIAASGLVLNHADDLGLPHQPAGSWLLHFYGAELPPVDSAYYAADVLFATSSGSLYADGEAFVKKVDQLIGAVAAGDFYIVATSQEFFLSSDAVSLIERYAPDANGPMSRLGTSGDHVIVLIQGELYEFNLQHMSLTGPANLSSSSVSWSQAVTPSDEQVKKIGVASLGEAINWERVLLDFHSGRILPTLGRYIADITALCLLYMCITGLFLWARKR